MRFTDSRFHRNYLERSLPLHVAIGTCMPVLRALVGSRLPQWFDAFCRLVPFGAIECLAYLTDAWLVSRNFVILAVQDMYILSCDLVYHRVQDQPHTICLRLRSSRISIDQDGRLQTFPRAAKTVSPTTHMFKCSKKIMVLNAKFAHDHSLCFDGRQIAPRERKEQTSA